MHKTWRSNMASAKTCRQRRGRMMHSDEIMKRLRRQNVRLKWWLGIVSIILAVLFLGGMRQQRTGVLRGTSFSVVDDEGVTVCRLGLREGNPELVMTNRTDSTSVRFSVDEDQ